MTLKYTVAFELEANERMYPQGSTHANIIDIEEMSIKDEGVAGLVDLIDDSLQFSIKVDIVAP